MNKIKNPTEYAPELAGIASLHASVLLDEVVDMLVQRPGGRFMDATLGMGGHAEAILRKAGPEARLLGLDRDAEALELAGRRLAPFGASVSLAHSDFANFTEHLDALGWDVIDGALVDLGVSSLQLDKAERGFSFIHDGPLDMRMNAGGALEPASALVNRLPRERLKYIIQTFGEEPQAGRIARFIDEARQRKPIETTLELAAIVENAYPAKWRATARNHPATRTFQALRLAVNGELEQLEAFLQLIVPRLAEGGRVAVISFHSLEDRVVKHFFRQAATGCLCPPQVLECRCGHEASLKLVTKKALLPTDDETGRNPRARSAKLRVAERTGGAFSLPDAGGDRETNFRPKGRRSSLPIRGQRQRNAPWPAARPKSRAATTIWQNMPEAA